MTWWLALWIGTTSYSLAVDSNTYSVAATTTQVVRATADSFDWSQVFNFINTKGMVKYFQIYKAREYKMTFTSTGIKYTLMTKPTQYPIIWDYSGKIQALPTQSPRLSKVIHYSISQSSTALSEYILSRKLYSGDTCRVFKGTEQKIVPEFNLWVR